MVWPLSLFAGDTQNREAQSEVESALQTPSLSETTTSTPSTRSSSDAIDLLRHFDNPDVPLPPSARVGDPTLKQRESQPLSPWQLWKFGAFAAVKSEYSRGSSTSE